MMHRHRPLTNDTDRLILLFVEPEGWDCWILPSEIVELRAEVESPTEDFEFEHNPHGITVWPSWGMGRITVWQGRREGLGRHERPAG